MIEQTFRNLTRRIPQQITVLNTQRYLQYSTSPNLFYNTVSEPTLPKDLFENLYQKNTSIILKKLNDHLDIDVQSTLLNLLEREPSAYNCKYDVFECVNKNTIEQDDISRQLRIDFKIIDHKIILYKSKKFNSLTPSDKALSKAEEAVFKSLLTLAWGEQPNNIKGKFVIREMTFDKSTPSYSTSFHQDGADRILILPIRSENLDVETIFIHNDQEIVRKNNVFTLASDQSHCVNTSLKKDASNGIRTTVVIGLTKY
tara:strand:+ start:661 stop:1431 length:771 start_codon:yes stop_codon:yes gene_type:complete